LENHLIKKKLMMRYQIVNAFSNNGEGGNPAAVIINQSLNGSEKQAIAAQIGFSETAFLQSRNNQLHIEFYTPNKPIAYCGHATIASVNILRKQNLIDNGSYILHTNENDIPVIINDSSVYMQQAYPVFEQVSFTTVAAMLNIPESKIVDAVIARNGVGYLLIELADDDLLFKLQTDEKKVYDYSAKEDLIGIYPFVQTPEKLLSRMFAPYYNIREENATGMAGGLLGGWLHHRSNGETGDWHIEQGHAATQPTRGYLQVHIRQENNSYVVLVGGEAVIQQEATLTML
jgi:PhzF family phenazine biosynthesis protein